MGERIGADQDFESAWLAGEEQVTTTIEPGAVVQGEVLQVTDEEVVIAITGSKSEGRIKRSEFEQLGETVAKGDTTLVKVITPETEDGTIRVSRLKAAQEDRWTKVRDAFKNHELIEGRVVGETKGGFKVEIGLPFPCFLPSSQASLKRRTSPTEVIGQVLMFEIKEMDTRRKNIVLSRRALLEKEQEGARAETLGKVIAGSLIDGVVKNITNFGVFVDIGGIDGLITLGDLSWSGFVKDASTIVQKGQPVRVKVLEFDPNANPPKIRLGLKQAQGDPWQTVAESVRVGQIIEGTVKSFTNFGTFVEVVPGVDGLVHISEMSWTSHVKHPSAVVAIGDKVRVKVVGVDLDKKKISLSLKQAAPDPWSQVYDEYPVGTRTKGTVTSVKDFGVFVRLPAGIEGRVARNEITWDDNAAEPTELVQVGQEVEVVVLNIDPEQKRIGLSMKATMADPWNDIARQFQRNKTVEGEVLSVAADGAVVKLNDETTAFLPTNEAARERLTTLEGVVAAGQTIRAKVSKLDRKGPHKIILSIRDLLRDEEAAAVKEFGEVQSSSHSIADSVDEETARKLQSLLSKPSSN